MVGTIIGPPEESEYPVGDSVTLTVAPSGRKRFAINLRIPAWSANTGVSINGKAIADVVPGRFLKLEREWQRGDRIALHLDMSVRYVPGDLEKYGRVSLYRGPILLAMDDRFGRGEIPAVDVSKLPEARLVTVDERINAIVDLATAENDHATTVMLHWYVNEQVEEEATADTLFHQVKMVEGSPHGLLMIDRELAGRPASDPTEAEAQ